MFFAWLAGGRRVVAQMFDALKQSVTPTLRSATDSVAPPDRIIQMLWTPRDRELMDGMAENEKQAYLVSASNHSFEEVLSQLSSLPYIIR